MKSRTWRVVVPFLVAFGIASVLACGSQVAPAEQALHSTLARGGGGGGGRPPGGEAAANNISFPVILSDGVGPAAFPLDGAWRFAEITAPETQCVLQTSTAPAVDPSISCYYGQHTTTVSETGEIAFDGPVKVWLLQQRAANYWKAFTVGYPGAEFVVSAVDVGDLLESSPSIATRQIRTEFNLLQNVPATDPDLGGYVVTDWTSPAPSPCVIPAAANQSAGCFAAVGMSGAVPGTQQSGNEIQGTDFGPGGTGAWPGTRTFVDPTSVRLATAADGTPIPVHAIVYSRCARLVIQRIEGTPTWDPAAGRWSGLGVGVPVVNVSAYGNTYSAEINSGGGLVYGYNWSASSVATGTYRLTFVLDGNDEQGPRCGVLKTKFVSGITQLANLGESNQPGIIFAGDDLLNGGDEGGLVYLDLILTAKGGGGRR